MIDNKVTINSTLRLMGFNWFGGKIFLPDVTKPTGYRLFSSNDPWLEEALYIESPQWHFFATDDTFFYCMAAYEHCSFPAGPARCSKNRFEIVQIDPESLNGPFTTPIHKNLISGLDILSAPVEDIAGMGFSGHLVGVKEFGVYVVGMTESTALQNLPKWLGLFGQQCLRGLYNDGLCDRLLNSATTTMMGSLKRLGDQLGEEIQNPTSQLNKKIDELFPPNQ